MGRPSRRRYARAHAHAAGGLAVKVSAGPGPETVARPGGPPPWVADVARRMARHFWWKLVGIPAGIGLFLVGYFHLLRNPQRPVLLMPLTALDDLVPFQPTMIVPYLSLWLYVGIAPGLLLTGRQLLHFAAWSAALGLAGLAVFLGWPTAVPRLPLDQLDRPIVRLLQGIDASGNACPSMHVAFAVFSGCWLNHLLALVQAGGGARAVNLAWMLAIIWSTVAIRQHVVLDVVAGALLGLVFAVASGALRRRSAAEPPGG